ncbi:MAG: hypothetical protein HC904_17510 [Blastochloris sp.]|nr:hypothetical protein [Blastochloris sp.]
MFKAEQEAITEQDMALSYDQVEATSKRQALLEVDFLSAMMEFVITAHDRA